MAILEVPSAFATPDLAYAAAVNGDTINIAAGSYTLALATDPAIGGQYTKEVVIQGATGNPADVTISPPAANTAWILINANNFELRNITFDNTISTSAGYAIYYVGGTSSIIDNCHINTGNAALYFSNRGYIANRLKVNSTRPYADVLPHYMVAAWGGARDGTIKNSSVTGYFNVAFYDSSNAGNTVIINCSVYMDTSSPRGLANIIGGFWGSNIYNSACRLETNAAGTSITDGAIYYQTAFAAGDRGDYNTVEYPSGPSFGGAAKYANDYDNADVVANGLSIFTDVAALNLHPVRSSLIDQNGDTTKATGTDLDGLAWNNPPSRGALEYVASGGSGKASLNNLVNLNNLNNLS